MNSNEWITKFIQEMEKDKTKLNSEVNKSIYDKCKKVVELRQKINKPGIKAMNKLRLQDELIVTLDILGNEYVGYFLNIFSYIGNQIKEDPKRVCEILEDFN